MQRWFPFYSYWYWLRHFRISCTWHTHSPWNHYLVIFSELHYFSLRWAAFAKNIPESNPGVAHKQSWPSWDSGGASSNLCKHVLYPPWTYLCHQSWALSVTFKLLQGWNRVQIKIPLCDPLFLSRVSVKPSSAFELPGAGLEWETDTDGYWVANFCPFPSSERRRPQVAEGMLESHFSPAGAAPAVTPILLILLLG